MVCTGERGKIAMADLSKKMKMQSHFSAWSRECACECKRESERERERERESYFKAYN